MSVFASNRRAVAEYIRNAPPETIVRLFADEVKQQLTPTEFADRVKDEADVIVQRANSRWVLDAKYKREFADESRADRFQMCAYAVAFDADRVTLVYPTAAAGPTTRELLRTTVGGKHLLIDSLALPMSAGPEACRAALRSIAARFAHGDGFISKTLNS